MEPWDVGRDSNLAPKRAKVDHAQARYQTEGPVGATTTSHPIPSYSGINLHASVSSSLNAVVAASALGLAPAVRPEDLAPAGAISILDQLRQQHELEAMIRQHQVAAAQQVPLMINPFLFERTLSSSSPLIGLQTNIAFGGVGRQCLNSNPPDLLMTQSMLSASVPQEHGPTLARLDLEALFNTTSVGSGPARFHTVDAVFSSAPALTSLLCLPIAGSQPNLPNQRTRFRVPDVPQPRAPGSVPLGTASQGVQSNNSASSTRYEEMSGEHSKWGPFPMSHEDDDKHVSTYQCLLRRQIEYFEVGRKELRAKAQGRNVPIRKGQVGIRCRHCARKSSELGHRNRGAVYYPARLESVFQAVQNMANNHIKNGVCRNVPQQVVDEIRAAKLRTKSRTSRAEGKHYWIRSAKSLGIVEAEDNRLVARINDEGV
jgi:hypothetical protein